jgi:hypothetical protein
MPPPAARWPPDDRHDREHGTITIEQQAAAGQPPCPSAWPGHADRDAGR